MLVGRIAAHHIAGRRALKVGDHQAAALLPSGYSVPRSAEKAKLGTGISANAVTVLFGDSGSGKSAFVKSVLDAQFGTWTQVWFGPDDLKTALSASRRGTLPLKHELGRILTATVNPRNVLVIDAAERIEPIEFGVIRQLLQLILSPTGQTDDGAWHVVVITQTQSWVEGEEAMLGGHRAEPFELEPLSSLDVMKALWASPSLGWLTGHDDTVAALTNLKTLAWVVGAGAALGSNPSGLASHTAIADRLWNYWTGGRADAQARLGQPDGISPSRMADPMCTMKSWSTTNRRTPKSSSAWPT